MQQELLAQLASLKGRTLGEDDIRRLLSLAEQSSAPSQMAHSSSSVKLNSNVDSVDDLMVASRAAELEMESINRYFKTPGNANPQGIDGLADEDLSSDSDDEFFAECHAAGKSALDRILKENSMVTMPDDDEKEEICEIPSAEADISTIPLSVIVPHGSRFIPLGSVQSVVEGLLVIGEVNPMEASSVDAGKPAPAACDIESLVFLSGADSLVVIGMVVDTLGTIKRPMHLVRITNKEAVDTLMKAGTLVGTSVCTLSTHSQLLEIDYSSGQAAIRGTTPCLEIEDCDDDGADEDIPLPIGDMDSSDVPVNTPHSRAGPSANQQRTFQPARSYNQPQSQFRPQQQYSPPSNQYQPQHHARQYMPQQASMPYPSQQGGMQYPLQHGSMQYPTQQGGMQYQPQQFAPDPSMQQQQYSYISSNGQTFGYPPTSSQGPPPPYTNPNNTYRRY